MGGDMYFIATDSLHGFELYKSDGTFGGTKMVVDINPAPNGDGTVLTTWGYFYGQGIGVMNGKVYFSGYPTGNTLGINSGLWSTDGTDTGTHLIKAFENCYRFFANNGIIYFNASTTNTRGIWSSDGSAIGTTEILRNFKATEYQHLGNEVYFNCDDSVVNRIYKSNGSSSGTVDLGPCVGDWNFSGANNGHHLRRACLTAFNNKIYFAHDKALWSTDGTVTGTSIAFSNPAWYAGPLQLTVSSGKLYFKSIETMRSDLWESDGSSAGTHKVIKADANVNFSILPTAQLTQAYFLSGSRQDMYSFNGEIYFYNLYDTTLTTSGKITPQLYKFGAAPSSISRLQPSSQIKAYPNPAVNTVTIVFEKPEFTYLVVTDQLGKSVYQESLQPGNKSASLQLGHLPSGMYYVKCLGSQSSGVLSVQIVH